MAFSRLFVCDLCDRDVTLVYAEEFTRDRRGVATSYPGYGKVNGLRNVLWCPTCRAERPHVLVELNPPADHAVVAYAEAQQLGLSGREAGACPECGTLLIAEADGVLCGSCDGGRLRFMGDWEDAV